MALVKEQEYPAFDETAIAKRDLVRARYHTWDEPRNGIVVTVTPTLLQVLFLPAVHQAACYYDIKAQEIKDGKWSVKYTRDLEIIYEEEMTYANHESVNPQTPTGEQAGS